jgi:two-component system heavy metal sensor histidine kinase CusS
MSWKSDRNIASDTQLRWGQPLSIAARMTIWYALLAFALVLGATGFLYFVLVGNLAEEDARILSDSLSNVQLLLRTASPAKLPQLSERMTGGSQQQPLVFFRVVNASGHVLLETPGLSRELPEPTASDLAAITSRRRRTVVSRSGKLFEVLTGRDTNEGTRFIQVAIDRGNEKHVLAQYREKMWLVLSLSLFLCSLVGYGIARGGMRPIRNISHIAERIGSSTLHERIATSGLPAELLRLAETFNNMLDRLQESFARVSQFSDDAAHELRTPVNNLRGEIEVALSKARSNEDYRNVLGSSLEECARISRVIESLLFLARAANSSEPLKRDAIDVGQELTMVREFFEAAAAEGGIELRVSAEHDLRGRVDRTLFQQAISNLISNAIAHTPRGGSVEVSARAKLSELNLSVADTGCGIPSEHLPHIFERFYRVDRARSGARKNVGLGLAVVKSIVDRHGGRIEVDSEVGRGTNVTLVLPR